MNILKGFNTLEISISAALAVLLISAYILIF